MLNSDLEKLKNEYQREIIRRERIEELLKNDSVQEYLKLCNLKPRNLKVIDASKILELILKDFKINKTNSIYVCTKAYYKNYHINYEDTDYYFVETPIDSSLADTKIYTDIENKKELIAYTDSEKALKYNRRYSNDFEKNNIVLNPYNTWKNKNGYEEVRKEFFLNALNLGQAKSKKLLLQKYPRL